MYCPRCGAEYRRGTFVCADCGVPLTSAPPARDEDEHEDLEIRYAELVTILETADPTLLILAQSLLEGAGIPSHVRGHGALGMTAPGRLGGNPIAGPVRLEVREDRAAEACEILERLFEHEGADEADAADEEMEGRE